MPCLDHIVGYAGLPSITSHQVTNPSPRSVPHICVLEYQYSEAVLVTPVALASITSLLMHYAIPRKPQFWSHRRIQGQKSEGAKHPTLAPENRDKDSGIDLMRHLKLPNSKVNSVMRFLSISLVVPSYTLLAFHVVAAAVLGSKQRPECRVPVLVRHTLGSPGPTHFTPDCESQGNMEGKTPTSAHPNAKHAQDRSSNFRRQKYW